MIFPPNVKPPSPSVCCHRWLTQIIKHSENLCAKMNDIISKPIFLETFRNTNDFVGILMYYHVISATRSKEKLRLCFFFAKSHFFLPRNIKSPPPNYKAPRSFKFRQRYIAMGLYTWGLFYRSLTPQSKSSRMNPPIPRSSPRVRSASESRMSIGSSMSAPSRFSPNGQQPRRFLGHWFQEFPIHHQLRLSTKSNPSIPIFAEFHLRNFDFCFIISWWPLCFPSQHHTSVSISIQSYRIFDWVCLIFDLFSPTQNNPLPPFC